MNWKACLLTILVTLSAHTAQSQTPAGTLDKLSDEYCLPGGGSVEESRKYLKSRGLSEASRAGNNDPIAFPLQVGASKYGIVLLHFRSANGNVESCRVVHLHHSSIDDLMKAYSARELPTSSNGTDNKEIHYLLEARGGGLLAKTITIVPKEGYMAIGYSQFPAHFREVFVGGRSAGSLLEQERKKNASTMAMKCVMDGRAVELQVAGGKGLMGPFPMDNLEVDGAEIAFKFQGVVHYFDFARKTGRRSTMGVNQRLECF